MMCMGVEMDIEKEREAFVKWFESRYIDDIHPDSTIGIASWEAWQAAKAQAVPEGFVLVQKEPCAYLIKHKLWNKNSQPEIYLADDFIGDDGVEREKLIVCIPLYKGDDEAQEQSHD